MTLSGCDPAKWSKMGHASHCIMVIAGYLLIAGQEWQPARLWHLGAASYSALITQRQEMLGVQWPVRADFFHVPKLKHRPCSPGRHVPTPRVSMTAGADPWCSNTKQHDTRAATTQSLHLHLCQVHSFSQDLSAQLKQKTHKKLHLFLGVARVKIWEQWPVWFNDLPTTKPGSFS